jgi:hypothetical protein
MKLLITFTLGISLISFYGCKKEIEPKNGNPTMEPSLLNLSNLPAVNGDRLEFNDKEQFYSFIEDLNDELDLPTNTEDDSTLFFIEQNELGGFYSLRQYLNIKNGITVEGQWIDELADFHSEEIDNMFSCDFVNDDALKTVLNRYNEVRIGDTIIVYYSLNITLKIHHSESEIIDEIREIDKCNDLLVPTLLNPKIIVITPTSSRVSGCRHNVPVSASQYSYYQRAKLRPTSCNPYKKTITIENILEISNHLGERTDTYKSFSNVTIKWGDGATQSFNNVEALVLTHTYATAGNYNVEVDGTFTDINRATVNLFDCLTLPIEVNPNKICRNLSTQLQNSKENNAKTWKMSYKYWVKVTDIKWPRIGSWTRAWKKKRNGKWKHKRTSIETYAQGKFKTSACNIEEEPSKYRKRITRKMRVWSNRWDSQGDNYFAYGNNECYSTNRLVTEGISESLYVTPCP